MLRLLAGTTHVVITGVAVVPRRDGFSPPPASCPPSTCAT
jgi:hypothetical protein